MNKLIVAALLVSGVLLFGGAALYHESLQEMQPAAEPHSTAIYMTEEEARASGECAHGVEPYYAHHSPGAVPMELLVGYRCSPEASAEQ